MMAKVLLAMVLSCLILLPMGAMAQLSCTVQSSGCGGSAPVEVFRMSSTSNAHAELRTAPLNYANRVCCGGTVVGLGNDCSAASRAIVLRLSGTTNAHVEQNTQSNYGSNACLSVSTGTVTCNYRSGSCDSGYACLASISSATNAHVANCAGYSTKVCCSVTQDLVPPTSSITAPAAGSWHGSPSFTVSVSDSDSGGSGLDTCQYRVVSNGVETHSWAASTRACNSGVAISASSSGYCRNQGSNMCTVYARAVDGAGNTGSSDSRSFSIDWTAPSTTDNSSNSWTRTDQTIALACSDPLSGCSQTSYCIDSANTCTPSTAGTRAQVTCPSGSVCTRYVRYRSTDAAGNQEAVRSSSQIRIDKQPPTSTILTPSDWENQAFTIALVDSDSSGSGLATCEYRIVSNGVQTRSGTRTCSTSLQVTVGAGQDCRDQGASMCRVYADARDAVGNTNTEVSQVFSIDWTAPSTTDNSSSASAWTSTDQTIALACSDPLSGCSQTSYCIDSAGTCAPSTAGTRAQVMCPDGSVCTRYVRYRSTDNAGNQEAVRSSNLIRIDRQDPTGTISINSGDTYTNAPVVSLQLTSSDGAGSGVHAQGCRYSNDGSSYSAWEACLSPKSWVLAAGNGLKRVYYQVRDAAGNTYQTSDTITLDMDGPSDCDMSMSSLPQWVNRSFTVRWQCSDPSGIQSYNVQYNTTWTNRSSATPWTNWLTGTTLTSSAFTPTASNQTYYFRVSARDRAGNTGPYSAPVSTTFDSENPAIYYSRIYLASEKKLRIRSAAWDNVSGIYNHTINCTINNPSNPQPPQFVQCVQASSFGGISDRELGTGRNCQTLDIMVDDERTTVDCTITAQDRAGNIWAAFPFWSLMGDHPLAEFREHEVFIPIGEALHTMLDVRNFNDSADEINVSLKGAGYPEDLARFLSSSSIKWMSSDGKNITVSVGPYERRAVYLEIASTGEGDYPGGMQLDAFSKVQPTVTDHDEMGITVGFPASFPGIEIWSILAILSIGCLVIYRKR